MSKFEERLWSELVRDHAWALAYPASSPESLRSPPIRARRQPLLGSRPISIATGLAALAAAVAAITIATTTSTTPSVAYAVTQRPDGTLSVSIDELTGVAGANAQLARLGVSVRVVPVQVGCVASGQMAPIPPSLHEGLAHIEGQGVAVRPDLVPAGDTLVLSARQLGGAVGLGFALYRGAAPACVAPGDSHVG